MGNIQVLHLNLDTIGSIWVNSNSLNRIWVIETASLKLGFKWNHLGTLEEVHSDLHISLSLLVVRRFDDDTAQRVSLCRRMWLLSQKTEAQTRPHAVHADPCRVVVGGGWLRC